MVTNALLNKIEMIRNSQNKKVIGQNHLTDALLIALLCEGHLLIEGLPGVAKTRAVKHFATCISGKLSRIQFTPDMLPSDITGNDIYSPTSLSFIFNQGPIFGNIILADEINRAPAKVQSALLEAMQEKQITVNGKTYPLPSPFIVMATQNPNDQEGTFVLPEAQRDRFLMNIVLSYPSQKEELEMLRLVRNEYQLLATDSNVSCTIEEIEMIQNEIKQIYVSDIVEQYIIRLIQATRPEVIDNSSDTTLTGIITYGAGPRATLALDNCARAMAWMSGREYVTGDDVTPKDLSFSNPAHVMLFGKGRKKRLVPLQGKMCAILKAYMKDRGIDETEVSNRPLFTNIHGRTLTSAGLTHIINMYADIVRVKYPDTIPDKISPHSLRHSKAMHLLQAGVNIIYVRDFLRHASIKTTEIYARADTKLKREALNSAYSELIPQSPSEDGKWEQDQELKSGCAAWGDNLINILLNFTNKVALTNKWSSRWKKR